MSTELVFIDVVMNAKSHGLSCYAGERRKVPQDVADYFAKHGWAKVNGQAAPVDTSDKTLDVQNTKHASGATSP